MPNTQTKLKRYVSLLLIAVTCGLLLLMSWTRTHSDQPKDATDYSVLRRTHFKDIIQRDLDILLSSDDDEHSNTIYGKQAAKVKSAAFGNGNLASPTASDESQHRTPDQAALQLALKDILRAPPHNRHDGIDISRPKPVQRGSEQIDAAMVQYNQHLKLASFNALPRNATPLLERDGYIRNCITGDVVGEIPATLRSKPVEVLGAQSVEITESRKASFQEVFKTRAWGHSWNGGHQMFNASGRGATLLWTQEMTATLHRVLSEVRLQYNISRVRLLDAPCGDMAWMSRFLQTRDDVDYTGIDIVSDLIDHHKETYRDNPHVRFIEADLVERMENQTYDVIVSRMALQHLFTTDAIKILNRFSSWGRYLLTTTFSGVASNEELEMHKDNPGRFRRLNLEIPPLSLTPPLCIQRDGPPDTFEGWDHFVGLWSLPLRTHGNCSKSLPFVLHGTRQILYSCVQWSDKIKRKFM